MGIPFSKQIKYIWHDLKAMNTKQPANKFLQNLYGDLYENMINDVGMFAREHYDSAKTGRLQEDWSTTADTPSQNFKQNWRAIIARSISSVDNNPQSIAILNTLTSNVIGQGLRPVARVKNKDGKPVETINKALDEGWKRYNDQWDSTGKNTHGEMQKIRFGEIFRTGSTITNLRPAPEKNYLSIANQVINVLRLDESHDTWDTSFTNPEPTRTQFGINMDEEGKAVSYWIQGLNQPVSAEFMRLNFKQIMAEQVIGQPWLIPALSYLWANKNLIKDKLIASRLQAMISLFVPENMRDGFTKQQNSKNQVEMSSGRIYYGRAGEEPKVIQADDSIKEVLDPLQRLLMHAITMTQGISYQTVTRDLVKTNMASGRMNVNEDRKVYRAIQKSFSKQVLQPDWNTFVRYMFLEGKIPGYTIVEYLKDPWKYSQAQWISPGFEMIDPSKEGLTAIQLVQNKMLTKEKWFGEQGMDWRDAITQISVEEEFQKSLGISVELPTNTMQNQSEEEEEEEIEDF